MAETTGLLNLHTGNRITSSNLVLSAKEKNGIAAKLRCFFVVRTMEACLHKAGQRKSTEGHNVTVMPFFSLQDPPGGKEISPAPPAESRPCPWWLRAVGLGLVFHMLTDLQDFLLGV